MAKETKEVEIDEREQEQPKGKICYGDCFACSLQQAVFCSSTHARMTMRLVERLNSVIALLQQDINELKAQIGKDSDELINPLDKKIAQKASGAKNRLPKQSKI